MTFYQATSVRIRYGSPNIYAFSNHADMNKYYIKKDINHMFTLLVIAAALFVGWNIPQPEFAKKIQELVVSKIRNIPIK